MHIIALNHVVWRIKRKNRPHWLRWNEKKWIKHSKVLGDFAHVGGKIPCADWPLNFIGGICPRPNHVFEIWWRSVQGFSVGWGSNFAIPHWLCRSSLQLTLPCERVISHSSVAGNHNTLHCRCWLPNLRNPREIPRESEVIAGQGHPRLSYRSWCQYGMRLPSFY